MSEMKIKGNVKTVDNVAYEIIPSEKGYAYMICISSAVCIICCFSYINSLGMLLNGFLNDHGGGVGGLSTVIGIFQGMLSISGMVVNIALKKFTLRQIGLFGAILYSVAWLLTTVMDSIFHMSIIFGVMMGMGQGILVAIILTIFNQYFIDSRMVMISVCQLLVSVGTMLFPLFLEHTLTEYGFRGSMLIISAIVLHTILCVISMHPVEWHSKWKPLYTIVPNDDSSTNEKYLNRKCHDDEDNEYKLKVIEKEFIVKRVNDNISVSVSEKEIKKSIARRIYEFLDLSILADYIFINISMGMTVAFFADFTFFLLYPQYLYSIGLDTSQVALYLTIVSALDLVGRVFLIIISIFFKSKSRQILLAGLIFSTIFRLVSMQFGVGWGLLIISGALGFFRGFHQITVPVIIAEYLPEKFTAAYGISTLITGSFNIIILPLMGYIRDYTNSFLVTFYVITFIPVPSICLWIFEMHYFKRKEANKHLNK